MRQDLEFLKQRADKFFNYASKAIENEDYEIAAFHLEQSAQLYLKYTLGLFLGDFPKVYQLRQLIENVYKISKKEELIKLMQQSENIIADLEEAYLNVRYLPAMFSKNQVEYENIYYWS